MADELIEKKRGRPLKKQIIFDKRIENDEEQEILLKLPLTQKDIENHPNKHLTLEMINEEIEKSSLYVNEEIKKKYTLMLKNLLEKNEELKKYIGKK